jgi:hypothetical protein
VARSVLVDGIEKTRRLEFEHALEALRIHTAVFEPADRSPHKRRALARLEALTGARRGGEAAVSLADRGDWG